MVRPAYAEMRALWWGPASGCSRGSGSAIAGPALHGLRRVGRSANPPSSKTYRRFLNQAEHVQPSLMWPQLEDTWDGAERLDPSIDLEISSLFQLLSPISVSYTTRFLSTPPEFSSLSASELYCRHQGRSERSHMSLERFCDGCGRQHGSAEWYYRNRVDSTAHEWLCSLQYLLRLPPQTMSSWRTFLYWNK